ncbi:hypothetical protein [Aerosticca soli]|jgi:hypothetical protein|uniref:Uncharacterized protein n=1 Tax=Aerosticca soli TaxID=2010829 RepID=A0A2Z6E7D2_9GAMM|nr:hypothetical protein [Aerosticca soli]MDI3262974.1 hypothetical protein [Fulvimonas sp.]BBD81040.1 hypothetical protein ALSL_2415 [Aerosticca soli]
MRKIVLTAAFALSAAVLLGACSKQEDQAQQTAQTQKVSKPSDPNDNKAWGAYLGQIVQQNMQGMSADRPYAYLVPAGDDDESKARYDRQLQQVQDVVARTVTPGNLLAFGGPNSAKTADFVIEAFKDAKPGSFKDVIVVVIGDAADKDRVTAALQPTGATLRYVTW